jgi:hypothetical protein
MDEQQTATTDARKKRGGCLKPFLIVCALIVIVIVVASVSASKSAKKDEKAAQATCVGKTYPDQQKTDICADNAGTVAFGGVDVTATPLVAKSTDFTKSLCSTVSIKNTSSKSQNYNELDFKIQTPSGDVATASTVSIDSDLGSGTVIAGATKQGLLCTDDKGEKGQYVMIYKPGWFDKKRGTWLFNV